MVTDGWIGYLFTAKLYEQVVVPNVSAGAKSAGVARLQCSVRRRGVRGLLQADPIDLRELACLSADKAGIHLPLRLGSEPRH
jgi:hypothetical protein